MTKQLLQKAFWYYQVVALDVWSYIWACLFCWWEFGHVPVINTWARFCFRNTLNSRYKSPKFKWKKPNDLLVQSGNGIIYEIGARLGDLAPYHTEWHTFVIPMMQVINYQLDDSQISVEYGSSWSPDFTMQDE